MRLPMLHSCICHALLLHTGLHRSRLPSLITPGCREHPFFATPLGRPEYSEPRTIELQTAVNNFSYRRTHIATPVILAGVDTEKIDKGRILAASRDIWRLFFGNHSLAKIQGETKKQQRENKWKTKKKKKIIFFDNPKTQKEKSYEKHVWTKFSDSRHFQWWKRAVFHEESDFQVTIEQFQRPKFRKNYLRTKYVLIR